MNNVFEKAKFYYENGFWSEERLCVLVTKNILTEDEYKMIIEGKK